MGNDRETQWDVIIIGGGPAGSTAATVLGRAGRRVLVLEKAKFPRFHIGESLLPYNREIFEDLGVWEKISTVGFPRKRAAQFWLGNGTRRTRLEFSRGSFTEYPEALQVDRARFDDILLQHSREHGAVVREESTVTGHRVEQERVVISYRGPQGVEQEVTAAYLIDASGLGNFTGSREALREYYPGHKKIAIFGHFRGVIMPGGEEEGDVLITRRANSWVWLIPLAGGRTSAGLVLDAADFKGLGKSPEEVFSEAMQGTPAISPRFAAALQDGKIHVMADFSYTNSKLASPRVLRVGDASGFIDPMFSSGVLLAMAGGRQAAQALDDALRTNRPLTREMERYERDNRKRVALYWEFIENFYQLHFAQFFSQPDHRLRLVCAVNAVLAGRTELTFAVWWRLRLFFFLAWLNRYIPLAERIDVS